MTLQLQPWGDNAGQHGSLRGGPRRRRGDAGQRDKSDLEPPRDHGEERRPDGLATPGRRASPITGGATAASRWIFSDSLPGGDKTAGRVGQDEGGAGAGPRGRSGCPAAEDPGGCHPGGGVASSGQRAGGEGQEAGRDFRAAEPYPRGRDAALPRGATAEPLKGRGEGWNENTVEALEKELKQAQKLKQRCEAKLPASSQEAVHRHEMAVRASFEDTRAETRERTSPSRKASKAEAQQGWFACCSVQHAPKGRA
ncbi:unnamed protein product [Effrenium voratum]|nr:unnamed protein product [Effrenium voratum]